MHELYATQAILDKALEKANEQKASQITGIYVVVGEISSYSEESVKFYWEQIGKGTIAEHATLHFRRVPAEVQCMACFARYHPQDGEIVCPDCGSNGAKILQGEEFYMEALDID